MTKMTPMTTVTAMMMMAVISMGDRSGTPRQQRCQQPRKEYTYFAKPQPTRRDEPKWLQLMSLSRHPSVMAVIIAVVTAATGGTTVIGDQRQTSGTTRTTMMMAVISMSDRSGTPRQRRYQQPREEVYFGEPQSTRRDALNGCNSCLLHDTLR
jgi:hypothetical protein